MKRLLFAAIAMSIMLALSGCGDGSSNPPSVFVSQILSSPTLDGDIELNSANVLTVTQGNVPSVFAGIDPVTGSEFRAFLFFPLTGANGVPGNAIIESATLDIFIDNISILPAASSIPIRIELVSFSPPTLLASDYDLPALAVTTIIPPISRIDIGSNVSVDVTSLMVEAQRRGLANFQIRILEDFGFVFPGLIEIDDLIINRAPLLTVTYF
ncbi:MAG: hypothetical protein A2079_01340 [Geobacteraceae bacterium GWC2_48_7]|nr:MAG: hypothetical protein A2079_01340 [Geobacteraceae bacterium GWC2_48_7]